MDDTTDFTPATPNVDAGETISFVVVNPGALVHEFVIGDEQTLLEHHEIAPIPARGDAALTGRTEPDVGPSLLERPSRDPEWNN